MDSNTLELIRIELDSFYDEELRKVWLLSKNYAPSLQSK